ncbi:MAG: hypothetical protein BGO01_08350 [Armatimonadetes bacterium 55-13]|nr:DinB family protein [Armatimonadota bacterium]OJU62479.1 MAG: hypothetical protein BGO01_08350 [Armatimonadetes bacterium 55-13]
MSDFAVSWQLSRHRFVKTISDLNQEQLNWRIYPEALTIAEMAMHVAGVEISFTSQILGLSLDELKTRLKAAATDGVVNDKPFPFTPEEMTPDAVKHALSVAHDMVEPLISNPGEEALSVELVSALGPVITGKGALARFAFHPGYHQGQAYLIRNAPGFPK